MKFTSELIKVSDLFAGYLNREEKGVTAYGGRLNVRPAYQREFVYSDKEQKAVIDSALNGFPLNTFYWAVNPDGSYELLDGQQRTMSILEFLSNKFMVDCLGTSYGAGNLRSSLPEKYAALMDYRIDVKICTGTNEEKLGWFRRLNTPQKRMTDQELRNAAYTGKWLSDAKYHFSSSGVKSWDDYTSGKANRQEILEYALSSVCLRDGCTIEEYMARHQNDLNADDLFDYFTSVISWVKDLFVDNDGGCLRREMKSVDWGSLFHECSGKVYPKTEIRRRCDELMQDDEIQCKKGIYDFLLTGDESALHLRQFTDAQKRTMYERQGGVCPVCGQKFDIGQMEGDHVTPWSQGGHTELSNGQMLCRDCNRRKSDR